MRVAGEYAHSFEELSVRKDALCTRKHAGRDQQEHVAMAKQLAAASQWIDYSVHEGGAAGLGMALGSFCLAGTFATLVLGRIGVIGIASLPSEAPFYHAAVAP